MPSSTIIADIMSKSVFTVDIHDTVHNADEIMRRENVQQVPVLDNKIFIGLITERTLFEYSLKKIYDYDDEYGELGHNKILDFQEIMTKDLRLLYPEDSVRKALEIFLKKKVHCLPVVDWENNFKGLVTVHDILLFLYDALD